MNKPRTASDMRNVATARRKPQRRHPGGVRIFISYASADEVLKNELVKHLEPLRRMGLVTAWQCREIPAGENWEREISKELNAAEVVLVLISIDFINSRYCYDIELEAALRRHEAGEATVIPIILRECLWRHSPIAALQALPQGARAVSAWPDRDEALTNVADGIRQIAEALRS